MDVGPQQREWVNEVMYGASPKSAFGRHPVELLTTYDESEEDGTMTCLKAEKYREELMT